MATGASTASLAILMIDARKGILEQTRRTCIYKLLLGIKQIVLAVNKLDLVDYSETVFNQISADFEAIHKEHLKFDHVQAIPLSALKGDNIIEISDKTPWYQGPTLMDWLETVENKKWARDPFAFPFNMFCAQI